MSKNKIEVKDSITGETYILPELRLKQELLLSFSKMNLSFAEYHGRKIMKQYDAKNYFMWIRETEYLLGMIYTDILVEEKNKEKVERIKQLQQKIFFDEKKLEDKEYKELMFYINEHLYHRGLINLSVNEGDWFQELKDLY